MKKYTIIGIVGCIVLIAAISFWLGVGLLPLGPLQQVEPGMARKDVETLLGDKPHKSFGFTAYFYSGRFRRFYVKVVYDKEDRLVLKELTRDFELL